MYFYMSLYYIAMVMRNHGGPENIEIDISFPCPKPANSKQIVIEVAAAGINPVDFKMRKGLLE